MAGSELLSNILNSDEFIALPIPVVSKIETHLKAQAKEIEDLKADTERLRVNTEQQYFEIEKQLVDSNNHLLTESEKAAKLSEEFAELEDKYESVSKKLRELENAEEETLSTQLRLRRSNEHLEEEKRDLAALLEKKSKEIDWLNEENKALGEKLSAANTAKCQALAQLEEIHNQDVMTKYREKRLEQENQMLQQQFDWMKSELDNKSQDLINTKKDQASSVLELQGNLEEKLQAVTSLQELVDSLRSEKEAQAKRITDLIERQTETVESYAQCEEQFRLELQSQKKLVTLYKESSEEAETKSEEVCRAIEELRRIVVKASQSYDQLEKHLQQTEEKHVGELNEKDTRIGNLEQELETANALMRTAKLKGLELTEEGIEALSPAAAAASKLLKSGMTLTQIYNEYAQNYDTLQVEKEENARLNQYINQIIQEIEEKAPLLKKQREDYETSLQSISQFTRQLNLAMLECEKTRSEADESKRKANHFQRESQKVKQQNVDLSQQVRYLLKEVEELRGGRVVREDVSSSDVSSSSQLITERLINFRNLEELQEQNQKLLEVVRDLSEKLEQEEKEATDSRITELKAQLTTAQEEMDELRSARTRQMEMVESIIRQRDMYRVLLAQTGVPSPIVQSTPMTSGFPATPTNLKSPALVDQSQFEEMKTALTELKSEYETYKREKAENEKVISEQLDVQRKEASSLRVQNAKLASQLDYATERYKMLQSNAESFKKEINSQREKNQKYTTSVMKHEMTINSLKEDLMTRQELMSRLEVQCENLRAERELFKTAEARLLQEKQNLMREQSSQNILMTSLQTIQNNLERAEYETKAKLGQQVEQLEKECCTLRRKLDTERDQHTAVTRHWENQVRELHSQLDGELTKHQMTREHEAELSRTLLKLQQELFQKEAKFASSQAQTFPGVSGEDRGDGGLTAQVELNEQLKDLKSQIKQSEAEIKALRNQVQKANEHAAQYKDIADGIEKGLKEQNEVSKQFQETLEAKVKDVEEQKSQLDGQIQNVDKERQELMNENIRVSEESHKLNGELRKQLSNLQHELEEAIERRELAIKVEQTSREDCQAQAKLAAEAQDKYERELMLHSADVKALAAVRKELEGFTSKLESIREEKNKSVSQLEISKVSWTEQEKLLKEGSNKLEQRCTELTQQNSVLHDQMSKLSSQVVSIQESALSTASPAKTSSMPQSDSEKSTEQLLEVIRFIRRDKDIAETKVDVIQSETNRLNQQNIQLERQLKDVTSALSEERERSQVNVQTARQHAELMKKVENHNLLADSNKLLREEKDKYLQQLRELEIKTKSLEEQIAPLQKTNREIQAQYDVIVAEKAGLQGEVDRWKNRTNHLVEQCNKADPEEQNRLLQERENLKKQISTLTENMHKLRAENSRLSSKLQATQKEVLSGKQEKGSMNQELEKMRSDLVTKSIEIEDKTVTINQLKKIGRKYKEQAETANKERDEAITHQNQLKQQQQQQQASNTSAGEAASAMAEKLQAAEKDRDELKTKLEERDKEIVSLKENLDKLQADVTKSNEDSQKMKADFTDLEKKHNQTRALIQTAKTRMSAQKADVDKLTVERNGLKEKCTTLQTEKNKLDSLLNSNQTATDDRVNQLEQELQKLQQSTSTPTDVKQNMDKLRRENTELQARSQQLQKMIEALQKQSGKKSPIQRPSAKSPADRGSMASSEAPRTANIRPMATPSVGIRPATPIQSVTGGQSAAKATASIRPMAITPTPGSHSGPTPTATVMPTTVSPQETHEAEASTSVPTGTVQGRPAQRVAPQVEVQISEPQPGPSVDTSTTGIPPVSSVAEPQPSTSSAVTTAEPPPQQTGKRQRESESQDVESEPEGKKSRVSLEGGVLPTITVTDEESNTTTTVSGGTPEEQPGQEPVVTPETTTQAEDTPQQATPEVSGEVVEVTEVSVEEDQAQVDTTEPEVEEEEVILVSSDEEDEDDDDDIEEEFEEEEEEEEIVEEEFESGEEPEEGMEEQYEDEEGLEEFEEEEEEGEIVMEEEETQDDGDDDIVVVEGDSNGDGEIETQAETEEQIESAEARVVAQPTSGQRPPPPLQPIIPQERMPQSNSRNQLAPFMFSGQAGGFEEGDDCTVPSTPTLYVPRRGDGFAEAISSPHVPQRFVFGSGLDAAQCQPELAQLGSQGALGMDDTRMDLSQFDEGNSRPGTNQSAAVLVPDQSSSTDTIQTISLTNVPSTTSVVTDLSETSVVDTGTGEVIQSATQEDAVQSISEVGVEVTTEGEREEGSESQLDQQTDETDTGGQGGVDQQEEESGGTEDVSEADRSASPAGGANRPRIQRIVWDDGSVHSAPAPPNPTQGQPLIIPPMGRGRAGRSLHRGSWNTYHRGRGASARGFRSSRGRRGTF